ncbi:MAG: exopolysaccharide biosynthesis polyprenyl glycosylphosphotransferase [Clostridia bacterium]
MHKNKYIKEKLILYFLKLVITLTYSGLMYSFWMNLYNPFIPTPFFRDGNYLMAFLFAAMYMLFVKVYGGFLVGTSPVTDLIFSQILATMFVLGSSYLVFSLLSYRLLEIMPFVVMLVLLCCISSLWCFIIDFAYFKMHKPKRTIVVFNNVASYHSLKGIRSMDKRFSVVRTINSEKTSLKDLYEAIKSVDAVFLCGVPSEYRNEVIKHCIGCGKLAYVKPKISDTILSGARVIQLMNIPVYRCKRNDTSLIYQTIKRSADIICSSIGIIVTAPIMLLVALAIKLYDKGPVFYKQTRLTLNAKEFDIIKFRTMRTDAEKFGPQLSTKDDPRITPIGKYLRMLRLDELPQLFNIFSGAMTIVGPRPERPSIAAKYERETPEFALRLQAKAGLTGYAQVYGKYNTPPYDKLQMDLMYIGAQSLTEDLKLILMTIKIIFLPSSTEGFDNKENKETNEVNQSNEDKTNNK